MAKKLQLRRGTTSQHSSFAGAAGEVTVDTDKQTLVVHNGNGSNNNGKALQLEDAELTELATMASGTASALADLTQTEVQILDGATVTTAELNILDGVTSTAAELNILDGVTSTAAELNTLDGFTGDKDDLIYAKDLKATGVTSTEFDYLDGVTSAIQTQIDSKQASDAELTELATMASGTAGALADLTQTEVEILDGATVTTAELNILDGITPSTAELNTLDGITATAAELNILDGITSTTAELNYSDGVTSNIQTQLNAKPDLSDDQTWTGAQRGAISGLTDASTIAVPFAVGNNFSVTLAGNRTLGQPSDQVAGQSGSIFVTQDGTGSRTLAYHADWKWAGGSAPTLSTAANAVDRIDYIVAASNKVHAVASLAVA